MNDFGTIVNFIFDLHTHIYSIEGEIEGGWENMSWDRGSGIFGARDFIDSTILRGQFASVTSTQLDLQ